MRFLLFHFLIHFFFNALTLARKIGPSQFKYARSAFQNRADAGSILIIAREKKERRNGSVKQKKSAVTSLVAREPGA